ncbi:MAG: WbqC family protein [Saprospiraceae bacterium]|nr:WbqC family protein [Saprospiraceae bacterium]
MIAAIHQPNFMPWVGYFHKMAQVDEMIFFDSVAISNGKTWTSRCKILLHGAEHWLTLPTLKSGRGGQRICDVELIDFAQNWHKTLTTIRHAYHRAPYFDDVFPFLVSLKAENFHLLADFNCFFIESVAHHLGLEHVRFNRSSSKAELMNSSDLKTDYIVSTCLAFGVDNYLSGKGNSVGFLELEKFEKAGIAIDFQEFTHPTYKQPHTEGVFVKGLSIVDMLMQMGWELTSETLLSDEKSSFQQVLWEY